MGNCRIRNNKLIYGDLDIDMHEDAPAHIKKALIKEQKGLPNLLRKEYEKFVEKRLKNRTEPLENTIDYEEIYSMWMKYGEILKKNTSLPSSRLKSQA